MSDAYTICYKLQEDFAAGSDGSEKFGTRRRLWMDLEQYGWRVSGKGNGTVERECHGLLACRVQWDAVHLTIPC
jgi:hypothetical protein